MKKIILTGGGTAGHVTPNIALIDELKSRDFSIEYIGSYDGIESRLIKEQNIPYHGISSGKLRRYFSLKNFTDPFRVLKGYGEAKNLIKSIQPDIVFSKGGFVSVPVVFAAKKYKVPVVVHESDMTPGLANKLALKACTKACCNFPETVKHLPDGKGVYTGSPIRKELLQGNRLNGLNFCGLSSDKPIIMIIGGSLGSVNINNAVRSILPTLLRNYQVLHLCGKGKLDESLKDTKGYIQYEYIGKELPDLFAIADIVISRAGANAICELLALKKPNLLIPLSANASRGDQILNANSFQKQGFSMVLTEEEMNADTLTDAINNLYNNRHVYVKAMENSTSTDAIKTIADILTSECKQN